MTSVSRYASANAFSFVVARVLVVSEMPLTKRMYRVRNAVRLTGRDLRGAHKQSDRFRDARRLQNVAAVFRQKSS